MEHIVTKMYVEKNKLNGEHDVVVKIGKFKTKEEALQASAFIYITKCIDLSPPSAHDYTEIELAPRGIKPTLH